MPKPLRAVLFDLDGTLIHSLPDLAAALNRLLAEEARPALTEAEIMPMVGDGAGTLVERAFAARGGLPGGTVAPLLRRFLDHYEPRSAETTRPWPGVATTLARLTESQLRLAVCTNKPSKATHDILAALGLDGFFEMVAGGDDVPAIKPDPAHPQAILDRMGLTCGEAVLVGDSINDVLAAKAAGLRSVVVSFGYARDGADALGADLVIDRFDALPEALAALP